MAEPLPISILRALRPKQWTKNAVVLAPFVFALGDAAQPVNFGHVWLAAAAAAAFCLVSSGIYVLNDIKDAPLDRAHPQKRHRPIAAGAISPRQGMVLSGLCLITGLSLGYSLQTDLGYTLLAYVALQTAYIFGLKHIALLDLLMIASGFVLRAIAGAVAIPVMLSPWLLVCTFLLALFLALCKRRQEKVGQAGATDTRPSLLHYDRVVLDQLIAVIASATLVSYTIYTLAAETQEKFGSARLGFTIPFVVFGLFRYLDLVYRAEKGERPEEVLLTDPPLLLCVALFGATVLLLLL